jgi:hypothetical protein
MTSRRLSILASVLGVLALAVAVPALSQSYGPGDQILTIGAAEFRPDNSSNTYDVNFFDGYLYGNGYSYIAPLRLPDGAEITMMCFYAYDASGNGSDAFIEAVKLPAGGQPAGVVAVPNSIVNESFNIGYGTVCTNPLSYTFHDDADLDGNGVAHLAHYVFAQTSTSTAIGGVRITWHRQVSPPPDTATFNDVPTSDPAFQHIEALVASGITAGCGGGNYCPDAPLTRRQMAVFLAKALGLHWAN